MQINTCIYGCFPRDIWQLVLARVTFTTLRDFHPNRTLRTIARQTLDRIRRKCHAPTVWNLVSSHTNDSMTYPQLIANACPLRLAKGYVRIYIDRNWLWEPPNRCVRLDCHRNDHSIRFRLWLPQIDLMEPRGIMPRWLIESSLDGRYVFLLVTRPDLYRIDLKTYVIDTLSCLRTLSRPIEYFISTRIDFRYGHLLVQACHYRSILHIDTIKDEIVTETAIPLYIMDRFVGDQTDFTTDRRGRLFIYARLSTLLCIYDESFSWRAVTVPVFPTIGFPFSIDVDESNCLYIATQSYKMTTAQSSFFCVWKWNMSESMTFDAPMLLQGNVVYASSSLWLKRLTVTDEGYIAIS